VRIKPGIFFADDPAFKGQKRELVAADYLFSFKRFADPVVKSPLWASVENWKVPETVVDHHLQRIQSRVVRMHTLGILCHHLAH
jgi:hypothetical protein